MFKLWGMFKLFKGLKSVKTYYYYYYNAFTSMVYYFHTLVDAFNLGVYSLSSAVTPFQIYSPGKEEKQVSIYFAGIGIMDEERSFEQEII